MTAMPFFESAPFEHHSPPPSTIAGNRSNHKMKHRTKSLSAV
jgi:hypothetical protein